MSSHGSYGRVGSEGESHAPMNQLGVSTTNLIKGSHHGSESGSSVQTKAMVDSQPFIKVVSVMKKSTRSASVSETGFVHMPEGGGGAHQSDPIKALLDEDGVDNEGGNPRTLAESTLTQGDIEVMQMIRMTRGSEKERAEAAEWFGQHGRDRAYIRAMQDAGAVAVMEVMCFDLSPDVRGKARKAFLVLLEDEGMRAMVYRNGGLELFMDLAEGDDADAHLATARYFAAITSAGVLKGDDLMKCGALSTIARIIGSPSSEAQRIGCIAVANVATDQRACVSLVRESDTVDKLVQAAGSHDAGTKRAAARAISNICSSYNEFKMTVVKKGALPPLLDMVRDEDKALKTQGLWAIANLTTNQKINEQIASSDGCKPLVSCLSNADETIRRLACTAVANMVLEATMCQELIRHYVLKHLLTLTRDPSEAVQLQAVRALSNMTADENTKKRLRSQEVRTVLEDLSKVSKNEKLLSYVRTALDNLQGSRILSD
eukprot:Rmarinus@m.22846